MGACCSCVEEPDSPQPQVPSHESSRQSSRAPSGPVKQNSTASGRAMENGSESNAVSKNDRTDSMKDNSQARSFSIKEIQKATRSFAADGLLGEGGFGPVFKGQLADGSQVAVKVLHSESIQGEREWEAEVRILGQLDHPNLVRLVGYCCEGRHRDLVYEFMPNGSLDKWLFDSRREPLSWDVRMKIALDAAKGLAFLHCAPGGAIIFRDLKPSNVLLDADFNAKLSDFGLARDGPEGNKSHVSTRVMGTQGYAAPEYVFTGHLTLKSDIYTYGVVLLEIISGRPALDSSLPRAEQNLVQWARPFLAEKSKFGKVVDPRLNNQYSEKALKRAILLALNCLRKDGNTRPNIADVAKWLEPVQGLYEQERQQGVCQS